MLRNSMLGTYRPITTTQTVNGVARNKPTGPQSQVQNTAAIRIARGEMPVVFPYRYGSAKLYISKSIPRYEPNMIGTLTQPGSTAKAIIAGRHAATQIPRYGMYRRSAADRPQRTGFGTPAK